ncbi:glycine/D-amino acid oxidase-like deaminating enzyme [Geodermatophilus bullaregiensis]|uniref:NAD(P)/FAD-dependent oxidoreductase n=1 Tax=Geodermatophilus bullaregiensis TaxID=1564160 RepID=UPI001956C2B9|nr:FAD-dependent oxidoreductase [Geodermatophilus bullaregiensis]MBM7808236.1 glycine/D-amino acid oxidase-like deaminating enzyme [Geodermatophilus bullaregiensis]
MTSSSVPLWQDEPYSPRPPLQGEARADVCVIGAGVGGLATARRLLDAGLSVVVLDRAEVASGASGRNGGFFLAGAAPMYHDTRRLWGRERAAAVHAATLSAQQEVLEVAEDVGARSCFRVDGLLRLAVDAIEADDVRDNAAALAEDGFPGQLVAGDDLPGPLARPERVGLLFPHDGSVHPVRWLRALADALESRGARICEHTPVVAPPAADGDGVRVRTASGVVRCDRAVVAVDGDLAALVPSAGAVRPRRLNMVATAPLGGTVLPFPVYARHGHEYAHQTADGRIALGGFSDLDGDASWTDRAEVSGPVQARLDRWLLEELRVGAPVTHRWAGVVGFAEDPLPRCGPVPGSAGRVFALGGYNGTGHVQAWVASRVVADLLVTGASASAGLYATVDAGRR